MNAKYLYLVIYIEWWRLKQQFKSIQTLFKWIYLKIYGKNYRFLKCKEWDELFQIYEVQVS